MDGLNHNRLRIEPQQNRIDCTRTHFGPRDPKPRDVFLLSRCRLWVRASFSMRADIQSAFRVLDPVPRVSRLTPTIVPKPMPAPVVVAPITPLRAELTWQWGAWYYHRPTNTYHKLDDA